MIQVTLSGADPEKSVNDREGTDPGGNRSPFGYRW
jgi:hypothetical protein